MLLTLDGSLEADLVCITCGASAAFRCTSCSCDRRYCQGCIVTAHVTAPFHFVEVGSNLSFVLRLSSSITHSIGTGDFGQSGRSTPWDL